MNIHIDDKNRPVIPICSENLPTKIVERIVDDIEYTIDKNNEKREITSTEVLERLKEKNVVVSPLYIERILLMRAIERIKVELTDVRSKKEEAKSRYTSATNELLDGIMQKTKAMVDKLLVGINACQNHALLQVDAFSTEIMNSVLKECNEKILPNIDYKIKNWITIEETEARLTTKLESLVEKIEILDYYVYNTEKSQITLPKK